MGATNNTRFQQFLFYPSPFTSFATTKPFRCGPRRWARDEKATLSSQRLMASQTIEGSGCCACAGMQVASTPKPSAAAKTATDLPAWVPVCGTVGLPRTRQGGASGTPQV